MIDLDLQPRGAAGRGRRWLSGRGRWSGVLVAAVMTIALAGAQRPLALEPALVLRGNGVIAVETDGSKVYVLTWNSLTSYRVRDGAELWTVAATTGTELLTVTGDRVLIFVNVDGSLKTSTLMGLDVDSGAVAWRQPGYVPAVNGCACASGTVVAEWYPPGIEREQEEQRSTPYVAGIDTGTGNVRWELRTPPGGHRDLAYVGEERVEVAMLTKDGELTMHSAETGQVLRTVSLTNLGPADGFLITGDRLLAYRAGQYTMITGTLFDLGTGRRVGEFLPGPNGDLSGWCGRVTCANAATVPPPAVSPSGAGTWLVTRPNATGGMTVLGRVPSPPAPTECATTGELLTCLDYGRVLVWPLTPPAGRPN
ncbi:PQQ-binding-like beta-propeller repeat protein [Dactylosporangium sp. NPDC051541]|uniref:outer membrane protein assembly factor BamB family protein n=1 Tax=Dactylosporangium sp. NPDC051541 TaxID=3363977 RepID=UPI00378C123C